MLEDLKVIYKENGVYDIRGEKIEEEDLTLDKINSLKKKFSTSVDFKALSHSVRVIFEVEELLTDGFITFPLKERQFVKEVKEGKTPVDVVMFFVNTKLDSVKENLDNSDLPERSNRETMNWLELFFFELYFDE